MTKEDQQLHFTEITEKMKSILLSKGNDYANEDRLSNFKLAGKISGLTAELNCLSLIATKVARLGVLLNSVSKPNNESIQDSILDLANYALLLSMILEDKEDEKSKPVLINYKNTEPYVKITGKPSTNTTY